MCASVALSVVRCVLLIVCGEMCSIVKCCLPNRAAGSAVAHSVQANHYLMASATKDIKAPRRLEKEAWNCLGIGAFREIISSTAVFCLCHSWASMLNDVRVIVALLPAE